MDVVLCIMVRNDMASMNAGKGMAQASHAAVVACSETEWENWNVDYIDRWTKEGNGFGTTLVFEGDITRMREFVREFNGAGKLPPSAIIEDPTYPVRDGNVTHFIPVETCAYAWVWKDNLNDLKKYNLHK